LITYSLAEYERKAIALANDPAEYAFLRDRISRARHGQAFDMNRLAQDFEQSLFQIAQPALA
jgi:predicted O-linked N-acetylglucosamine transferase (SPINDLY family)